MKNKIEIDSVQVSDSVIIKFRNKECPGVIITMQFIRGKIYTESVFKRKSLEDREFADWVRKNTSKLASYFREECEETKLALLFYKEIKNEEN